MNTIDSDSGNFVIVLANKYKIEKIIGNGKFGAVYQGVHLRTNKKIAIKKEYDDSPIKILKHETTILNYLYNNGCKCIPKIYWFGLHCDSNYLVMTNYNCSLYDYRKKNSIDENHINSIMFKMIDIIEDVHQQFIIHRDIKPQNFMINEKNDIHLIDFGLANVENPGLVLSNESKECIVGTPNYISYNIHCGFEPMRRDDLISVAYIYLFLLIGSLPWEMVYNETPPESENSYPNIHILSGFLQNIKTKKKWENIEEYCSPKIRKYLEYCYDLKNNTNPNYEGLKQIFSLGSYIVVET